MAAINPHFQKRPAPALLADELLEPLLAGERASLSRALTLVESRKTEHRREAEKLVQKALPHSGKSLRLGITGVPGVGKSTFIESFGAYLIKEKGKKLAVLAIDPSSGRSGGSILGDKTRMQELAQNPHAFIRPSPTGGSLGGVARKTREAILLCEAAGYDFILVETVGVGQSETAVHSMVDFFLLLLLAGAGDELQGIKRGIMEMADLLVVNKSDQEAPARLRQTLGEFKRALHLFPPNPNQWIPTALPVSAIEGQGLPEVGEQIDRFARQQELNGHLQKRRAEQNLAWFEEALSEGLRESFYQNPQKAQAIKLAQEKVRAGQMEPGLAAQEVIRGS